MVPARPVASVLAVWSTILVWVLSPTVTRDPASLLVATRCQSRVGHHLADGDGPAGRGGRRTDRTIQDAVTIDDADIRNEVYAQNAAKLQTEAASVFLLHEGAAWGVRSDVEGFKPHPLDYYVLTADLAVGG